MLTFEKTIRRSTENMHSHSKQQLLDNLAAFERMFASGGLRTHVRICTVSICFCAGVAVSTCPWSATGPHSWSTSLVSSPSLLVDLLGVLDLVVLPVVLLLPRLLAQSQRVAELVKLLAKRFCERLESEHQRE